MISIRKWIQAYFGFSAKEVNGFLFMLVMAPLLLFSGGIFRSLVELPPSSYEQEHAMLDSLLESMEQEKAKFADKDGNTPPSPKETEQLFKFDPNTASVASLQRLGVPTFLAKRIEKYRSKGGRFRKPADLQKIYGFPAPLFNKLQPFIQIPRPADAPSKLASNPKPGKQKVQAPVVKQDLATADTAALKKVYGIGSVLSARIVKFRDKLGGFHHEKQLYEVYGLKPEVAERVLKKFALKSHEVRKIAVNKATVKTLGAHPYISWEQARALVAARKETGNFTSGDSLLSVKGWDAELVQKLIPYFTF